MHARGILRLIMFLCGGFLLFAFYLQHYQFMLPCPLCVVQRYAYIGIMLCCLIGRLTPFVRTASFLAFLAAAGGGTAAVLQLQAIKNPTLQCGRDPLETAVNSLPSAQWLPSLFKAEGYCGEALDRIIGLTPPQWSLAWCAFFACIFLMIVLRYRG